MMAQCNDLEKKPVGLMMQWIGMSTMEPTNPASVLSVSKNRCSGRIRRNGAAAADAVPRGMNLKLLFEGCRM
jgi:hypothetical protein